MAEQTEPQAAASSTAWTSVGVIATWLLLAGVTAAPATAASLGIEPAGPPPEALAAPLRAALAPNGVRAVPDAGPALEIWPVRELAAGGPGGSPTLGVAFPELATGSLVGVLRLSRDWTDYRGDAVPAGLYTLRYAVQPDDGYHMGVSLYRDFLLLLPAADDSDPAVTPPYDTLVEASRVARSARHPAVLALFPTESAVSPRPAENDLDQPMLALPVGSLTLGLVVAGTGDAP